MLSESAASSSFPDSPLIFPWIFLTQMTMGNDSQSRLLAALSDSRARSIGNLKLTNVSLHLALLRCSSSFPSPFYLALSLRRPQCRRSSLISFSACLSSPSRSRRVRPSFSSALWPNSSFVDRAQAHSPKLIFCCSHPRLPVVYLFLINYGRAKPDDTQHAIQSFLVVRPFVHCSTKTSFDLATDASLPFSSFRLSQDSEDRNPLIRALALRTMTSIPLPSMIAAVVDPLRHGLKDSDPYVRKTAAISFVLCPSTLLLRRVDLKLIFPSSRTASPNSTPPLLAVKLSSAPPSSPSFETSSPTRILRSSPTRSLLSSRSRSGVMRLLFDSTSRWQGSW